MTVRRIAVSLLAACALSSSFAQDAAPLVREEKQVEVKVKKRGEPGQSDATPTPTPDPATVIVAVVNRHSITREQLDRRVRSRMRGTGPNVVHADAPKPSDELLEKMTESARTELKVVDLQDDFAVDAAVRQEEARVVDDWMDQMMLADEARRQGFLVADDEFRARIAKMEAEFRLSSDEVKTALDAMGMTREELEGYIYDAILVEKLLARFVELNYSDAHLHTVYEQRPGFYMTPAQYEIAHFTISLVGDESPKYRDQLKKDAEGIRKRLKAGEKPETLFEEMNRLEYGFFGATMSWNLESPHLHPALKAELGKMKDGDISDVIVAYRREGKAAVPESYHVAKVLKIVPATGLTFETALPRLREAVQEGARAQLLAKLAEAKTHKRLVNLKGLSPERLQRASADSMNKPAIEMKL